MDAETRPDSAPAKTGMPTWLKIVLVIGGLLMVCSISSAVGAISILVPRIQAKQAQTTCAFRLRELGGMLLADTQRTGRDPERGGTAYLVALVQRAGGDDKVLRCPSDDAVAPGHVTIVDEGDPYALSAAALRTRCSYAVRDFARYPISDTGETEFVAAEAGENHRDGLMVLFSDGSVQLLMRERLGFGPGEEIVVGPDSPHAELRKLCIVPAE